MTKDIYHVTNLSGEDLREVNLVDKDFSQKNLNQANLNGVEAVHVDMKGSSLVSTDLSRANLKEADLTGSHIERAKMKFANLRRARLRASEIINTKMRNLKIWGAETKYLQKKAVGDYTIPKILERTDKIGFGTPGDEWMLTDDWKKRTEDNYRTLIKSFPEIFRKEASLPQTGFDRWKVNQLAIWKELFVD